MRADARASHDSAPDTVVVGAGHNGLTAAFYLARAGRKVLVLERRDVVGGGAITSELHPGFSCPTLSHEVLLHDSIARDMGLRERGVEFLVPPVDVSALSLDGPLLVLDRDVTRAAESIARYERDRLGARDAHDEGDTHGARLEREKLGPPPVGARQRGRSDAESYREFVAMRDRFARVVAEILAVPPPQLGTASTGGVAMSGVSMNGISIGGVSIGDAWRLLKAGRAFRALGSRDSAQLLRWLPMPVADLLSDTFNSELLRAALAGPGLSGTAAGPRSAGSVLMLLMRAAHAQLAGGHGRRVRGGPGRLTEAMASAARAAGAEIRTGQLVERIVVTKGAISGLAVDGREIAARTVVSAVDPKTTFERLVGYEALPHGFSARIRHFRAAGTLAKVNLALSALPRFRDVENATALSGRIHVGGSLDDMERAFDHVKYGEISTRPWLEITIPSILDASLAPPGQHVASIYVHYVPVAVRGLDRNTVRERVLDILLRMLEQYAPGISSLVLATHVLTPADLEADYGLSGGHVFHGELALDQLFSMRPVFGHATYDSPIAGLFLCGAGTHPGGVLCGTSGRLAAARVLA